MVTNKYCCHKRMIRTYRIHETHFKRFWKFSNIYPDQQTVSVSVCESQKCVSKIFGVRNNLIKCWARIKFWIKKFLVIKALVQRNFLVPKLLALTKMIEFKIIFLSPKYFLVWKFFFGVQNIFFRVHNLIWVQNIFGSKISVTFYLYLAVKLLKGLSR